MRKWIDLFESTQTEDKTKPTSKVVADVVPAKPKKKASKAAKASTDAATPRLENHDRFADLRRLNDMIDPIESAYRTFMEANLPPFIGDDDEETDENGQPVQPNKPVGNAQPKPTGSGQSSSTTGTVAPGAQNAPATTPPATAPKPTGPAPMLTPAQQQAKDRDDAAKRAANPSIKS